MTGWGWTQPKKRPSEFVTISGPISSKESTPLATQYGGNHSPSEILHHDKSPRHTVISWLTFFTWFFLSIAWMAAIIALLWLNFSTYIIGPTIPCLTKSCESLAWDTNSTERARLFDKWDHDILGVFQIVAKALEVWFILICAAVVYELTMMFGRLDGGLPIGFILTHLEFTDLPNLLNPVLWTAPMSGKGKVPRKVTARFFLFAIFVTMMTILANLMGPACAILLIPKLTWLDTKHVPTQIFQDLHSTAIPRIPKIMEWCTEEALVAGNFSCTYNNYDAGLEQLTSYAVQTLVSQNSSFGNPIPGTSQEGIVNFMINISISNDNIWAPNRQVLQDLTIDLAKQRFPEDYGKPATRANDSLELMVQREGPSVGFALNLGGGTISKTTVSPNKSIFCVDGWIDENDQATGYTKCYRVGSGFNPVSNSSSFYMRNGDEEVIEDMTNVEVFFSDKAVYYNDTTDFGSGIQKCLDSRTARSCDWDRVFSIDLPENLANNSRNMMVTAYSVPESIRGPGSAIPDNNGTLFIEHISYLGFPIYSFDASLAKNPASIARLTANVQRVNETPIAITPDWFLAAWSVDRDGSTNTRPAQEIARNIPLIWSAETDPMQSFLLELAFIDFWSFTQMLSIMPFDARNITDGKSPTDQKPTERVLRTWIVRYVWAYSIDSRSSQFAYVIAIAGCVCVLIRILFGLYNTKHSHPEERFHSPTDFMASALRQEPGNEIFEVTDNASGRGTWKEKEKIGQIRYRIREDKRGRVKFDPPAY